MLCRLLESMADIFHITKWQCLPSIVADDGLWCDNVMAATPGRAAGIGYAHIKERRARTAVPLGSGGMVSDYVPFYFVPRSPMLLANKSGEAPGNPDGQAPIVHLLSSTGAIIDAGLSFVFTDGHPVISGLTQFFDSVEYLDQVDWAVLKARYWNDIDNDMDRKRRRQAEFLVHSFVPWNLVDRIAVLNEEVANRVKECLVSSDHKPHVAVVGLKPTTNWPEGYYY